MISNEEKNVSFYVIGAIHYIIVNAADVYNVHKHKHIALMDLTRAIANVYYLHIRLLQHSRTKLTKVFLKLKLQINTAL